MLALPAGLLVAKLVDSVRVPSEGQTTILGVLNSLERAEKCFQMRVSWPATAYSEDPPSASPTPIGKRSPLSVAKIRKAKPTFLRLFTHLMRCALALALARAG